MIHILILHASMGAGHLSAAHSLADALGRLGAHGRVEDGLDYTYAWVRTLISKGYPKLCERRPSLWGRIYERTDHRDLHEAYRSNTWRGLIQRPIYAKLETLIHEMSPDAIVCTQQFPLLVVRALRHQDRISQPVYVVITDFEAHSSWLNEGVEAYFIGSEFTREALASRGIPGGLLHVTGIPVRLEISRPKPRDDMRSKLDLPPDTPVVTLFGGGIQPTRVRLMVEALLAHPAPLACVTVAGRNPGMAEALADLKSNSRVELRNCTQIDYVDDLVAASDLVVTKSGGMITSEVLARGTPMIIVDPIPGQEEWNADFVAGSGAGIQIRRPEMVPAAIQRLLAQPQRLQAMRAQAQKIGRPHAALDIARHILAHFDRPGPV